jgi:hypothetical protein
MGLDGTSLNVPGYLIILFWQTFVNKFLNLLSHFV